MAKSLSQVLKIPFTALARSRSPKNTYQPFVLPLHPARATPPASENKLAMDSDLAVDFVWANNAVMSSYLEGQQFLGYPVLTALAQRPEYRVISEVIANEMTREWIELKSTGDDKVDKIKVIEDELDRFNVKDLFNTAALYDGLMGRSHVYIDTGDTDDKDELRTSIGSGRDFISKSKMAQGKLRGFKNVEAMWVYPMMYESTNPLKPDWYRPRTWYVMGSEVHHTRLLSFIGRPVPDMLKPAYSFGGLSLTQMAKPYVDNWLTTRQSVTEIIRSFTVFLLKTDLAQHLQPGGDEDLFARMELFNNCRNNQGLMTIDKDKEEFENVSAPLGGLHELQAQSQEHMAAVSRIPLVKLLGIQPSGLNASSEGEIRSFYDWIDGFRKLLFTDNLTTIVDFIQLNKFGSIDHEITIDWKDLWQLDEAAKMGVEKTKADIHDAYVSIGAVSADEVREALVNDEDSLYSGLDLSSPAPGLPEQGEGEKGEEHDYDGEEDNVPKPHDPSNRIANSLVNHAVRSEASTSEGFTGF